MLKRFARWVLREELKTLDLRSQTDTQLKELAYAAERRAKRELAASKEWSQVASLAVHNALRPDSAVAKLLRLDELVYPPGVMIQPEERKLLENEVRARFIVHIIGELLKGVIVKINVTNDIENAQEYMRWDVLLTVPQQYVVVQPVKRDWKTK